MGYESEIFISYRRTDTVGRWVRNHFLPRLEARLNENSAVPINVYCDLLIEEGEDWAQALRDKLKRSKLLLAVWSADYFRSSWCMTEWQSFRERERALAGPPGAPRHLVYPVRYADGNAFHPDAKATQCTRDFSALNCPDDVFRDCPDWVRFDALVTQVAVDLVDRLGHIPGWRDDFPIVQPQPLPDVVMERPVL